MAKESGSEKKSRRNKKNNDAAKAVEVAEAPVVEETVAAVDEEAAAKAAEEEAAKAAEEEAAAAAKAAEEEAAAKAAEEAAAAAKAAEEEAAAKAAEEARAEAISQLPASDQALYAEESILAKESAARETREEAANVASDDDQPDVPENEKIKRYDIMITSDKPGYKPPKVAIGTMVQQLVFRGYASATEEAIADDWTEIYFTPGPTAHELFMEKGTYTSAAPVYNEIIFRVSEKPFTCEYSDTPKRPLYWGIEICGARFKMVTAAFKKFFLDAYKLRIAIACCDAQPAREHKVVAEEEKPVEKQKRERGRGLAGVEVTEL